MEESIYVTVDHLDSFQSAPFLRPGDRLILRKDRKNIYDDEAIIAYKENDTKVGYVANSVGSVMRGTYSAGRIYDHIGDDAKCVIRFMIDDMLIVEIVK